MAMMTTPWVSSPRFLRFLNAFGALPLRIRSLDERGTPVFESTPGLLAWSVVITAALGVTPIVAFAVTMYLGEESMLNLV